MKQVYLVIIDTEHGFIHVGDATVNKMQTKTLWCFVDFEIYFRMFYEMCHCSVHFITGTHRLQKRIMVLLEGPSICLQVLFFLLFLLSLFSLQLVNVFLRSLFKVIKEKCNSDNRGPFPVIFPIISPGQPIWVQCCTSYTAQKMKFSIKDFFSKCDLVGSFLRIWSHLLKKFLMENIIFCAVM